MTQEQAQKVLDELQGVRLEMLNGEAKRLFEAIMRIADIKDNLFEENKKLRDELKKRVKIANKGINSLMQSRSKWKHRYYKMKNENKDLQKSVEQIYDDYQDIGKMAFNYSDKIEEQEKMIDLMASEILILDIKRAHNTYDKVRIWETEKGIKQYFKNKAKERNNDEE